MLPDNLLSSIDVDDMNKVPLPRKRITKRNSLSSLAEAGLVAPPTPLQMQFHNVIPSRATLYFRQRSRHHSKEDINPSPSSPDRIEAPQVLFRKSLRTPRTSRRASGLRALYSMKSNEMFNSAEFDNLNNYESGNQQQSTMNQLVQDIDGLMTQLTTIKRRLSHTEQLYNDNKYQASSVSSGPKLERSFSPLIEEKGFFFFS